MSSTLSSFESRALAAEEAVRRLEEEVNVLRNEVAVQGRVGPGKHQRIMGLPSTMADDYQLNMRTLMSRCVQTQPEVEVVTAIMGADGPNSMDYHRCTWRDVIRNGTKLASALQKNGVVPGDRIGTFMWNNTRHLTIYFGVPSMGAVVHTLNIRLHPHELAYIIQHAQDKIIFVDATIVKLLERVDRSAFASVEKVVVCGMNEAPGNWSSSFENAVDFDEFLSVGEEEKMSWPELDERSGLGLCYTSGTTGNPKGVVYSHRSTYLHTLSNSITDTFNVTGTDVILPIVPMFHALSWGIPFHAMMIGYKLVFYNHFRSPEQLLTMIRDHEVTTCAGVPTVIQGFMREMQSNPEKWESLRGHFKKLLCGGSAPPRVCIEYFWNEWGIEVIQGWGMTELNPVGTIARRCVRFADLTKSEEEKTENNVCAGAFLPCVEGKLVGLGPDFDVEVAKDGEQVGELLVRGPFVTTSYYKMDEEESARSRKFDDGWLVTGDVASITSENRLYIRDRSKDLIKSGGEWISSVDMENMVMGMDVIKMACVVAIPHPKWDERPVVVACLKDEHKEEQPVPISLDEVKRVLEVKFAKFQLPDDLILWDDIPLTGTGKMAKKIVREKLVEEQGYVLPSLRG